MSIRRYDASELGRNARVDERGFLTLPAYVTRVGVFPYKRADGSTVMELRPPEEVFDWESLQSLAGAPITMKHPAEFVTPENAKDLEIGIVGPYNYAAGPVVEANLSFRRADAIAAVQSGEIAECSCGYSCDIDATPGTWNGQAYDQIQKNIRYNHVAVGPKNWARLGRDMMIRADSEDAVQGEVPVPREDSTGPGSGKESESMKKIRIDGVEYEIPEQTAAAVAKELERRDASESTLRSEVETQRKRADGLEAERDTLKTQLATATDPKRRADEVQARVELVQTATKVLGETERFDGLSDRQVREKVIAKVNPALKLDGRSDEYITAAYEAAFSMLSERNDGLALAGAIAAPGKTSRVDESLDLDAAYNKRFTIFSTKKGA